MNNENTAAVPTSKRFFPALLALVGEPLYTQTLETYRRLYSACDLPENATLVWHLIEGILPGLALYRTLLESGETQESALTRVDACFENLFAEDVTKMKRVGRLPFVYALLRLIIRPSMRRYPPAGWDIDWLQNDAAAVRFNMKNCFYFNTLKQLGAPELAACFCRVDDLVYGNMSSAILWQRTKTIARGSDLCDFCFARAKR